MIKQTKYFTIPFIALGIVLSSVFGIEYNCQGEKMFPTYYGSPFVFKEKSLGSSMEYFYSISGILLNVAIWSVIIALLRLAILKTLDLKSKSRILTQIYKGTVIVLVVFSALNIGISYIGIGQGFKKGLNYWYMNLDKEAKDWGMECEGTWEFWIL
jgi:hypothetical protein